MAAAQERTTEIITLLEAIHSRMDSIEGRVGRMETALTQVTSAVDALPNLAKAAGGSASNGESRAAFSPRSTAFKLAASPNHTAGAFSGDWKGGNGTMSRFQAMKKSTEASQERTLSTKPDEEMATVAGSSSDGGLEASLLGSDAADVEHQDEKARAAAAKSKNPIIRILACLPTNGFTTNIMLGQSVNSENGTNAAMELFYLFSAVIVCMLVIMVWHPKFGASHEEVPSVAIPAVVTAVQVYTLFFMFTRFFVRVRGGKWVVIDDVKEIRRRYVRSWFVVDLITMLPFENIFLWWANRIFYICLLRHFLRYFRGLSLGRSVIPLASKRHWFAFASFCMSLMLFAHILACIFWAISDSEGQEMNYLDSIYWTVATLTSVGYGDIPTPFQSQRGYALFAMLMGTVAIATATAYITSYFTRSDPVEEEETKKKETMLEMMRHYDIPWPLRKDVMAGFGMVLNRHNERFFASMTADLPDHLQEELNLYFAADLLKQVPLFAQVRHNFVLVSIARRMRHLHYKAGEAIFSQDEVGTEIYFLINGSATVQHLDDAAEATQVGTVSPGDCFGEAALLVCGVYRRTVSIIARMATEVVALSREDMLDVLREHHTRIPDTLIRTLLGVDETTTTAELQAQLASLS